MRQWLRLVKEDTPGTTPTPDADNSIYIDMEENDPAINLVPVMYKIRSAMPKRGMVDRLTGSAQDGINGSIPTALYHEQADFWRATVFEPAYSGTAPNPPTGLPTVTVDRGWLDDTGTARYERYKRCMFNAYTITGSSDGAAAPIRLSVNVIGGEYDGTATIAAPSCTAFPTELYLWSMCDFELNDVSLKSYVSSLSLNVTHLITPRQHMNRFPDSFGYHGWEKSFSVEMDMFSHAYRAQFFDIRSSFAEAIYATNNSFAMTYATDKKVTFNFYNALFSALDPRRPPGGNHTQSATIVPFFDCTNLDLTCTITNPA